MNRNFLKKFSYLFKSYNDKYGAWLWHRHIFISIFSAFVLISVFAAFFIYRGCQNEFNNKASFEAKMIEVALTEFFNETSFMVSYVAKQIAQVEPLNIEQINSILSRTSGIVSESHPMYSWTLFDWVTPTGDLVANSKMGIFPTPLEYKHRTLELCGLFPNTLQFSNPTIGTTSGMWVIPTGMGITNEKGAYIGLLSLSVNVARLNNLISKHLPDPDSSFIVLNQDYRVVFQSANNGIDPKSSYYKDSLHNLNPFTKIEGRLESDIKYKGIIYTHYKKISPYPYIILTGTEKVILYDEIQSRIFARLIEIIVIGFFFAFFVHFLKKRFLKTAQTSHAVREHFSQRMNLEMQEFVASILGICDVLLRYYKGNIHVGISQEKKINLITEIQQAALNLNSVTTNVLNLTYVDINSVIDESVMMFSQLAMMKKTKINFSLQHCLAPLYADEVRLRQVIITLLSIFLEYNPNNSTLNIKTLCRSYKGKKYLVIKMQDNGFNLTVEDIRRISERFNVRGADPSGLNPEFGAAERLIDLHNGRYYFYNEWQGSKKGKNFILIFPYDAPEASNSQYTASSLHDNVVNFVKHTR